jgi:lipoate---protein ligase
MPIAECRALWRFDVERPAVVLGSRQGVDVVDVAMCERHGVDVVKRRSGGGAVLLVPGDIVWVDLIVPRADRSWDDDVHRAMAWLGEAWAEALGDLVDEPLTVHRGPTLATEWSELICFAGIGAGEVLAGGHKLVGLSQRRTRDGARFQCAIHRRADLALLTGLLASDVDAADLPGVATLDLPSDGFDAAVDGLLTTLAGVLAER